MPLAVHLDTTKPIGAISARDPSNTLQTVKEAWLRTSVGIKQIFGQFAASVTPANVSGNRSSSGTVTVTTKSATVTVTGGTAPVRHAWTKLTGSAGWSILAPANASTGFSFDVAPGDTQTAVFRDIVTDAGGATATVDVPATCRNFGGTL